jgi:Amt family ammonium transporter
VVTFLILKVVDAVVGLRVDRDEEREGLDTVLHGESGYTLGSTSAHIAEFEAVEAPRPEPQPALATK